MLLFCAVSSRADLQDKRGTFIYDNTACRELILVTEADGSESSAYNADAEPPVPLDPVNLDALSRKLSRMLGRGEHLALSQLSLRYVLP